MLALGRLRREGCIACVQSGTMALCPVRRQRRRTFQEEATKREEEDSSGDEDESDDEDFGIDPRILTNPFPAPEPRHTKLLSDPDLLPEFKPFLVPA